MISGIRTVKDITEIIFRTMLTGKTKKPWVACVDITNRCNLNCSFCYWRKKKPTIELSDSEMIEKMKELYHSGFKHLFIMGGEPMLRPRVVNEATKIFPFSFICTNGTVSLNKASPTLWFLSLDGPEKIHDKLRGRGSFKKIINNLKYSKRPVIINMTLNRKNCLHIEELINVLLKTKAVGIGFSFYSPCLPKDDPDLAIPLKARGEVMDSILKLKKRYGRFIMFTEQIKNFFDPEKYFYKWNSKEKCFLRTEYRSFGADGKPRYYCPHGETTTCHLCGCGGVPFRYALASLDLATLRLGFYIFKQILIQNLTKDSN